MSFRQILCGEGGIRTHVPAHHRQNDFESFSLRPLRYFSVYIFHCVSPKFGENNRREQIIQFEPWSRPKPYAIRISSSPRSNMCSRFRVCASLRPLRYVSIVTITITNTVYHILQANASLFFYSVVPLLVGRPASGVWKEHEEDYRKVLVKHLADQDFLGPDKVVVMLLPESFAAMLNEVVMKQQDHRMYAERVTLVIDAGSSTLDVSLVKGDEADMENEQSFNIDGNDLDGVMLKAYQQLRSECVIISEAAAG